MSNWSECNVCRYYDSSVDACNCDDKCYIDGARDFAEWLQEYVIINIEFCTTLVGEKEYDRLLSFLELLDMWQKEQK